MHKHNVNLIEGPLFGKIMLFTLPVILTNIIQLLFNAADLIILGQFGRSGSDAVAAVGCVGAITNLMINFILGLSAGSAVTVAQAIGTGNHSEVHKAVHTIVPFSIIAGAVVTFLGVFLAEPVLILMNTPEKILGLSTIYMQLIFAGKIPNMIYNFGASIMRAAGESKKPLYIITATGILKIILTLFFVVVLKLDVASAALATTISQILAAVMIIYELIKRSDSCKLEPGKMHFYRGPLKKIFTLGVPAGIQSSLFAISNVIIQSSINSLEIIYPGVLTANAAGSNILGFAYTTGTSFQQASMNFAGQNAGAGKFDRVRRTNYICLAVSTCMAIVLGALITLFAEPLLKIYITDSPAAVRWGIVRMLSMAIPYFLQDMMNILTGTLRGLGLSMFPMLSSVLGVCVFRVVWIFTIFEIPAYHTPESLWISYPISWALTAIIQYFVLVVILKKKIKLQKEKQNNENKIRK